MQGIVISRRNRTPRSIHDREMLVLHQCLLCSLESSLQSQVVSRQPTMVELASQVAMRASEYEGPRQSTRCHASSEAMSGTRRSDKIREVKTNSVEVTLGILFLEDTS